MTENQIIRKLQDELAEVKRRNEAQKGTIIFYASYTTKMRKLQEHWQGKFLVVKHENNQLRKRLFPTP